MSFPLRISIAISWAITAGLLGYAYFSHQASQLREAQLQQALSESQQLVLQVSNRLAATEAQLNTLKISQAAQEQEQARLLAEKSAATEKRRPAPSPATLDNTPPRKPAQEQTFGQGVSSFFKRIRQGFSRKEAAE